MARRLLLPEGAQVRRDDDGELVLEGPGITRCTRWPSTCAEVQRSTPTCFHSCSFCSGDLAAELGPRRRIGGGERAAG